MSARFWTAPALAAALVATSLSPAAASWGPTKVLSPAGKNVVELRVAAAKNGDAVAVWTLGPQGHRVVQASRRPAGRRWSAPRALSTPGGARELQVASDAQGHVCAVWTVGSSASPRVQVACFRPGPGWAATRTLSPGGSTPRVVVRADVATVVWASVGRRVQVSRRVGGGSWSSARALSPRGKAAQAPDVAAAANGRPTVVWSQGGSLGPGRIMSRTQAASGAWQDARQASPVGQLGGSPRIAEVDDGTALVTWVADPLVSSRVWAAHRAGTGPWEAAVPLSAEGDQGREPEVAANRTDDVFVVVWTASPSSEVVQEVRRHFDGSWTAVHQVSTPGSVNVVSPDVALNDQQTASVVWQEHDGAAYRAAYAEQNILDDWAATVYADASTPNGAYSPQVAATTYPVVLVWSRYDTTNHLRAETRFFDPRT